MARLTGVGAKGHDFRYLVNLLRSKPIRCEVPNEIHAHFQFVNSWSTRLRYEVFQLEERTAERFLNSGRSILEWTERS